MTTSSRADRSKTIYEILFRQKPDITRIPPYGAFTCIYKERRDLNDQSFGLTSIQGVFIGIAHHRKTLGYCITDGSRVSCTRHHIAFDPYLYPFKMNATAPPAWQTFHNLTTTKPEADIRDFTAPQTTTDLPHTTELQDNSDESDFDPEVSAPADMSAEIDDILPELLDSDSDEEQVIPATIDPPTPTRRSIRVRQAPVSFKAKARQTTYERYNRDDSFRTMRDALVNTKVRKYFPGYGIYTGVITSYYPSTDTYHLATRKPTPTKISKNTSREPPSMTKIRRRQSRFFKLRNHASSVCSPLQQTRSFQRRRTCPLVPWHTI
jgi:hypothetical protein